VLGGDPPPFGLADQHPQDRGAHHPERVTRAVPGHGDDLPVMNTADVPAVPEQRRPVPSKKTLVQAYGVAPGTVERALAILKAEGLLKTVMGRGLYVVPEDERRPQG
jgi:Bacterial regulatory proteins, gntR family